jgi:hypothetical protein
METTLPRPFISQESRILDGEKPTDMPVQQATKFDLIE